MNTGNDAVRFLLDGETVEARGIAPTTTLLQYLRNSLGRTGTKEGCAEGDCGACTVVVGELTDDRISYKAVNSCIRFLPTLDGKEVVTVESLQAGALHPVQQAMVDAHASQCGFCTPGFVMSLFALYLQQPDANRAEVVEALAGNLCRCTGYRPIIQAGCRMYEYDEPAHWSRRDAHCAAKRERLQSIQRGESLAIGAEPGFYAPRTLAELSAAYESTPDALLLAGSTDVGLWVTKQLRELPRLIYIGEVAELKRLQTNGTALEIGAAVTLTRAYAAIAEHFPSLTEIGSRFASPPIRNSGTLCGNVANGSPIGDSMPFLLALGARVRLQCATSVRELPLAEFYLGYQKKALARGEFVSALLIPLQLSGQRVACYKVSKRYDQDISAVCAGFAVSLGNGRVDDVRIAYGGMAAIPKRAERTEAALLGQPWTQETIDGAMQALGEDYAPISDMRASGEYRLKIARNLLKRFYLEHGGSSNACRLSTTDCA